MRDALLVDPVSVLEGLREEEQDVASALPRNNERLAFSLSRDARAGFAGGMEREHLAVCVGRVNVENALRDKRGRTGACKTHDLEAGITRTRGASCGGVFHAHRDVENSLHAGGRNGMVVNPRVVVRRLAGLAAHIPPGVRETES